MIVPKKEVMEKFETIIRKPESDYGDYLYEDILAEGKYLINKDRNGVIEVCREWLLMRKAPHTFLAVVLIGELKIRELREDLELLRGDIMSGKVFRPYNIHSIDTALKLIN
jgi:hypothetical protein